MEKGKMKSMLRLPFIGALLAAIAALAASAPAQEPAMVLKSLDNLESRLGRLEAELAKVRKGQAAAAAPVRDRVASRADSLLPAVTARVDSLAAKVAVLETAWRDKAAAREIAEPEAAKKQEPIADTDSLRESEVAALMREVRELTAYLKGSGSGNRQYEKAHPPAPAAGTKQPGPMEPMAKPAAIPALPGFDIKADIQIQGERRLATGSRQDNLDDFWGRLNFGGEYKSKEFESKLNLRIFPEGFGFEPLTGATFDTAGQGALKVQSQPSSRVVVNHAWARFVPGPVSFNVGRFETMETHSSNFGNYIDLGAGGKFLSRPAAHNALEAGRASGGYAGSVMLGTGDRKLNRGFLRVYQKYSSPLGFQAGAGYRVNLFDRFKYEDEELLQRFDGSFAYAFPLGWKAFAEAALLQVKGKDDDIPVVVGIQPPTGKILDLLSLEAEWLSNRKVAGKSKPVLVNLHVRKAFGKLKLESGLFSDGADPDANAFGLGLRMTANLK